MRASDGSESTFPLDATVHGRGEGGKGATPIRLWLFALASELLILINLFILTRGEKG